MKIVSKKIINGIVSTYLVCSLLLSSGCMKKDAINEREPVTTEGGIIRAPNQPIRKPPIHPIPRPIMRCINSYQDIIDVLGASRVIVNKVVLAGGAIIEPGNDVAYIAYEAIPSTQSNSLFDSKLSTEWRWPGSNWQLSTANVWTLGCVYQQTGQPSYTNLVKGFDTILINTCFYWSTNEHTGERIDYLIVE